MPGKTGGKPDTVDVSEFEGKGRRNGPRCWYVMRDFSPEQRAKIDAAMARKDITGAAITRVIRSWKFSVDAQAVNRHRNRECLCAR